MAFIAGYNKAVTLIIPISQVYPGQSGLSTSGATITLNITEHSWSEAITKLEVTHSGTAGIQALIAGVLTGDGNVKGNSDSSVVISGVAVGIVAGINCTCTFGMFTTGYQVPCMITKVNYKSVVMGLFSYDFDVSLNSLAGSIVRPTT